MIDVITLELVRESLISIVQEMRINLTRTAYSSILYEGEDFSCVLMSPQAEIVAMSKGMDHPIHIFPVAYSTKTIQERFGSDINQGDVFFHNDTYTGGTHLNDIAMVYPVFLDQEIFMIPVVRAHWADVGGMTPGSISGQATEVYQEGIRIPPIRVYEKGIANEDALELIFANMRVRREREGDFRAMLGTCYMAELRLKEIQGRFGKEVLKQGINELMDRSERRMRQAIGRLRPGEYFHETYMESGKQVLEPQRVFLNLTIAEDQLIADFTGTSKQSRGPNNVGPGLLPTGVFAIAKSFLDSGGEINHGSLRPIKVTAPEGTLVNCRLPAPCGGSVEATYCMGGASMGSIAPALDGKVIGDIKGGGNHTYIGGINPETGEQFVFYEYPAGGVGAFDGHDGNNVVRSYFESDITPMQPIEAVEQKFPLRVEHFGLREDSGGDGQWRGGLGCRRAVRLTSDMGQFSVVSDHNIVPPFGVSGGNSGTPNRFSVIRNDIEMLPPSLPGKISGFELKRDDVLLIQTAGGGGFGNPLDRDPAAVLEDVLEGHITEDKAHDTYGVVIVDRTIDQPATLEKRTNLIALRNVATIRQWDQDEYSGNARVCYINRLLAANIGVEDGSLVEIVNPVGVPLRGWVRILDDSEESKGVCYLGPIGKKILRVNDETQVEIRRLKFDPVDVSKSITPYTNLYS